MSLKRCCCVFAMKKTPLRETEPLLGRLQFVVIGEPSRSHGPHLAPEAKLAQRALLLACRRSAQSNSTEAQKLKVLLESSEQD